LHKRGVVEQLTRMETRPSQKVPSLPARFCALSLLLCFGRAAAATRTFVIDSNASTVRIHVGILIDATSLTVGGDLSLHGAVRPIVVPVQIQLRGDALTCMGKLVVKQTDFGIEPTAAGGGLVKVEDEVTVTFGIISRAGGS